MAEPMFQSGDRPQDYLNRIVEASRNNPERLSALQQLREAYGPTSQEQNDAEYWAAVAQGFGASAPTFWQSLANAGAGAAKITGAQFDRNKVRQEKLAEGLLKDAEKFDPMALAKLQTGMQKGMTPTIKVVDGKLVKYDPGTGLTEVLSGTQDQIKTKLYTTFLTKAVANEMPNPELYAQEQTENALKSFGGMTVKGPTNNIPGTQSTTEPNAAGYIYDDASKASLLQNLAELLDKQQVATGPEREQINRDIAALRAEAKTNMGFDPFKSAQQTVAPAAPAGLTYPDKAKKAMEKGTAEEAGKALGKEHTLLNEGAAASGRMISQLDLLEKLYSTPNMPEGELGPAMQQLRSGLTSLKVLDPKTAPEVGAADLARAVASNFALHIRTGDGSNLLPGAMSNYEDKLLQQMAPVLSLTNEGRLLLVQMMKETSKSNMRMAHEANLMADANRGILPSEWRTRRERIMKEEMARLADLNRQIMQRAQQGGQ